MTNADKYLKEGVDLVELARNLYHYFEEEGQNYPCDIVNFFDKSLKSTLTEDEKVILNKVNTDIYAKIGRYKNGEIIFRNIHDSYIVLTPYFKFENMFQFIQPRRRI